MHYRVFWAPEGLLANHADFERSSGLELAASSSVNTGFTLFSNIYQPQLLGECGCWIVTLLELQQQPSQEEMAAQVHPAGCVDVWAWPHAMQCSFAMPLGCAMSAPSVAGHP